MNKELISLIIILSIFVNYHFENLKLIVMIQKKSICGILYFLARFIQTLKGIFISLISSEQFEGAKTSH